jgi:hypothetical protein
VEIVPYDTAEAWAIGEAQGKFLSRGGKSIQQQRRLLQRTK